MGPVRVGAISVPGLMRRYHSIEHRGSEYVGWNLLTHHDQLTSASSEDDSVPTPSPKQVTGLHDWTAGGIQPRMTLLGGGAQDTEPLRYGDRNSYVLLQFLLSMLVAFATVGVLGCSDEARSKTRCARWMALAEPQVRLSLRRSAAVVESLKDHMPSRAKSVFVGRLTSAPSVRRYGIMQLERQASLLLRAAIRPYLGNQLHSTGHERATFVQS